MKRLSLCVLLFLVACTSVADHRIAEEPSPAVAARADVAPTQAPPDEPDARAAWLAEHAVPLATVEAGHGFADLAPLKAMIGSARVVGLGEGTHGTREHFQAKHRLLEFLVEEMGFSIFSIEANMPEAYALDAYVLGGEGDVNALIAGMYFWTWDTEEVREMVEWMRAYNRAQRSKGSDRAVHFTGFDMQTGTVALRNVRAFLDSNDAAWMQSGGSQTLDRLASHEPRRSRGGEFGCATGRFPVESARGKKVRFSGWIKSEGVAGGWAGLWWRVDGPTPWFDNMQDRGLTGTSDWEEREIELDVPADAKAIYFGLVMPGEGKAWFDDLSIEIDGTRWQGEDFDLDFEGAEPRGILPANPSGGRASPAYAAAHDASAAKSGKQSFVLEKKAAEDPDAPTAEEIEEAAASVLAHLRESRERYAGAVESAAVEWAVQNARVVHQWAGQGTSGGTVHRDQCMAENVAWILEQDPAAKVVLWAHNWHLRDETPFMGSHLRERFGADYVNLAFCSSHGKYTAMRQDGKGLGHHSLGVPPVESFEAILETTGKPILLVDLRQARADDPGSAWLTEERPFGGIIGALEMPDHYQPAKLQGHFDLLIWVKDTSASHQLRRSVTQ